jgi:hypothetical protein
MRRPERKRLNDHSFTGYLCAGEKLFPESLPVIHSGGERGRHG